MDLVGTVPNLMVARTFSKAYGLAGLRLGVLAGPVELMRWIRRVLSPYSVNSLALACLPPRLRITAYLDWYVSEVLAARAEFEAALDAVGVRRWPSQANFVLVELGATARGICCGDAAARRAGARPVELIRDATDACASRLVRASRCARRRFAARTMRELRARRDSDGEDCNGQ